MSKKAKVICFSCLAALILLLLAVRAVFKKHLTSRFRCALWALALLRLLLPIPLMPSPFSLMNALPQPAAAPAQVPSYVYVSPSALPAPAEHIRGDVSFRHVRFGYDPEQPVIHDWSCDVPAGRTVAIVGPTGAGKTTVVNLLMRFYDANSGTISIDGIPTTAMTKDSLRSQFGMVLQDTWLYHGTIRDNIAYGKPNATDEEVIAAAKAAHCHEFIERLPNGYQTHLAEGGNTLSGGEKQRIAIARAILKDAPILLLDESTASLKQRSSRR